MCCLWRFVSGLRNRSRLLFRLSYKEYVKLVRFSSVDICISCRVFYIWLRVWNKPYIIIHTGPFLNFFFTYSINFSAWLVFIFCQLFPFTLIFTLSRVSSFSLHIKSNHIATLVFRIVCLVFLYLQAILVCYATNSGITKSPHRRFY